MSIKARLAHVLRHSWMWPIQFWLRPLDVVNRVIGGRSEEAWTALLGGGLLGAIIGIGVWLETYKAQAIWSLAVTGAVSGSIAVAICANGALAVFGGFSSTLAGSVICASSITIISAIISTVFGISLNINTITLIGSIAFVVIFTISLAIIVYNSYTLSIAFLIAIALIGIYADSIDITISIIFFIASVATTSVSAVISSAIIVTTINVITQALSIAIVNFFVIFMLMIVLTDLSQTSSELFSIYCLAIGFSLCIGMTAGFFCSSNNIEPNIQQTPISRIPHLAQKTWLTIIWLTFPVAALFFRYMAIEFTGIEVDLEMLTLFSIAIPFFFSGLPLWPIVSLISLWQFREKQVKQHNQLHFRATMPFNWQAFAYPLPGLRQYLIKVCKAKGPEIAFKALQDIQSNCLQQRIARQAALKLANAPATALPFCGYIAIHTNSNTLSRFAMLGYVARAIAVLPPKQEKEYEQPLLFFPGNSPETPPNMGGWLNTSAPRRLNEFHKNSIKHLSDRIIYALHLLDSLTVYKPIDKHRGVLFYLLYLLHQALITMNFIEIEPRHEQEKSFRELLVILLDIVSSDLQRMPTLLSTVFDELQHHTTYSHPWKLMGETDKNNMDWLIQGREVLARVSKTLLPLEEYRKLATPAARRELLKNRINALESLKLDEFSWYWRSIGQELADIWIPRLNEAMQQASEWLRLELQPMDEILPQGRQTLRFHLANPTETLARQIRLIPEAVEGLEWGHTEARQDLLEGGTEARLGLELVVRQAGVYRIAGRLEAEDLDGHPFVLPFAFQLCIAVSGRPYRKPNHQPYVTGAGVNSDQSFVGRRELLNWLRGLWLQPEGKPAVALVGQRRIGKTSLLFKIRRDGLADTGLLPVYVNVQGVAGDYDFLADVARQMAEAAGVGRPGLNRVNPYPDFKAFLLDLPPTLGGQRFLLMLDEADLIPQRQLGDLLPGFLRALMQEPQYPTLLLFCGTHALQRMGAEYSSILFNTAQFRTVSYLTEMESKELLEKPARGILEFDPGTPEEGFSLTRGQPLLLQSLGAALIDRCNTVVLNGGERSDYITPYDLNQAADALVKQGNAAFENHWDDNNAATHRLLSTLAWATDETNRMQLDLPGIEAAMESIGLGLPAGATFKIVERLADEEILTRAGPTYRFAVPLYRRWIDWRWPPDRVREERLQ